MNEETNHKGAKRIRKHGERIHKGGKKFWNVEEKERFMMFLDKTTLEKGKNWKYVSIFATYI